jgi:exopolyphosphatase/guanosine-5'-triphosphate,3'-diphosphate pyrophosphatase
MRSTEVTGIIDIGSNTVRLAVYRLYPNGAYRIIDQGRWPARLSRRLNEEGALPEEAIRELSEVLLHYCRICSIHGAQSIRAVATAAIRAAANRSEVIRRLSAATGLELEILSGEDEARFGSEAMLRTLDIADGFVVDIGGGSTEITLLRNRRIEGSISFPIGCVNTAARYRLGDGPVSENVLNEIQDDARMLFEGNRWISNRPGLPLIGLGGTVRAFAKLRQSQTEYPFPQLHGYEQSGKELALSLDNMAAMTVAERRKVPGLSKDRADVIVPGMAILHAVMQQTGADRLVVCGAGLRDGLYFETCLPHPVPSRNGDVLEESVRNLNALYPGAPGEHLEQVRRLALTIFDRLAGDSEFPKDAQLWLETAARLFRIGAAIDLNDLEDHTFYMLVHRQWNGLPHRDILLTAAIASFRGMNPLRRKLSPFRSMLRDGDAETAAKLGAILQLAVALDRSESQAIRSLQAKIERSKLILAAKTDHSLAVERMEVNSLAKDFKKIWGLTPSLAAL